jgi:cytochrome P450
MLDEKQHTNVKRMMAPSFALSSVMKNYESKLNDCAEEFIEKITQMRIFDITEWFSYYTMDSMNSVAFSANLGLMKHATDIGSTLHFLRSLMSALIYVIAFPQVFMWLSWAMSYLVGLNGPLVTLARSRVESRFDQADLAHGDLLDGYLQARRDHPEQISSEQVLGMTLSTILAGSDSTAFTLMWTLHYLLQNPQALKSVKEEIAKAVLEGNLNYPPALKELVKLPYLQATIKEGLRCSAVFRLGVQRISPKGGIKICDRHVPEGITVGCYQEVVHRDRTVYGDDAASFRPDRWLEASEIDRKMMERCGLWYGSGKHACIGQHFAQAQMLKVLAMMIMKLEVSQSFRYFRPRN